MLRCVVNHASLLNTSMNIQSLERQEQKALSDINIPTILKLNELIVILLNALNIFLHVQIQTNIYLFVEHAHYV